MELFISKTISSLLQTALFSLIPLIWWCVSSRKKESFLSYIGIKKIKNTGQTLVLAAFASICFALLSVLILYLLKGTETAVSEFYGLGISALPAALVYAIFNTALPEEILFRGFFLKRIAVKTGFAAANIIQGLVFGLLHGAMFFSLTGAVKAVFITLFTAFIAVYMGYINEKKGGGSILPSWIIHSLANIFSSVIAMFSLI